MEKILMASIIEYPITYVVLTALFTWFITWLVTKHFDRELLRARHVKNIYANIVRYNAELQNADNLKEAFSKGKLSSCYTDDAARAEFFKRKQVAVHYLLEASLEANLLREKFISKQVNDLQSDLSLDNSYNVAKNIQKKYSKTLGEDGGVDTETLVSFKYDRACTEFKDSLDEYREVKGK